MEMFDFTLIWAALIGFGIMMYILLDGFDLGVGILYPFAPDEASRDVMMNSVAPIWDGNETWLIMGGAGLWAAFPLVYSVFLPALYIGVFLMLAGLIFRGVAFEFRFKSSAKTRRWWNLSFFLGSSVDSFAQGAVVGAYIQGFETENKVFVGGALDWLTPFTVMTGFGLMAGYALLGATWVILKTEGEVRTWAYGIANKLLWLVLAVFLAISVWTPTVNAAVFERWFGHLNIIWILPALVAFFAYQLWRSLRQHNDTRPFVMTLGIFMFTYLGLVVSKWPVIVPPDYTLWDAASAPESQLFLLLGFLFVLPIVLAYTTWTYWVFRGKVRPDAGYH